MKRRCPFNDLSANTRLYHNGYQVHGCTTIAGGISSLDMWCKAVCHKIRFVFIGLCRLIQTKNKGFFAYKLYANAGFWNIKSCSLLVILLHSMFLFYVCCRFLFMEVLWALSCQGLYGSSGKPKTGNVATGIVSVQVQRRFNHPTHGNCWQGLLRMPAHFERLNCFIFKNT